MNMHTYFNTFPFVYLFILALNRRIGGKIKASEKDGFTFMVTADLKTSTVLAPFLVFTGKKVENARDPVRTNDYKYSTWREDGKGISCVNHQESHWFDEIISVRYLKFLVTELYPPPAKVGLTWDHAPQHCTGIVREYIDKLESEGRLVVEMIPKGLTSVIQVCDLITNRGLKRNTKSKYYNWRASYIRDKREKLLQAGNPNGRISVRVSTPTMIGFIEEAVEDFNAAQLSSEYPSVKKFFRMAGQDPWFDCKDTLKAHLDSLEKDSLYKRTFENQLAEQLDDN